MNLKAFLIPGIASTLSVIIPVVAMSKPETSSEGINLEVNAPQNTWENNNQAEEKNSQTNRIEVNPQESFESNERLETFELERTENNCSTTRTNQSVARQTFEGYCDWGWEF